MATTTTNFGWDIPQSTDLVKDGATAIAALGQDIDTAFVDLKGGTTGQVLAKATNTDLDFTWVAQDDSNAIQNAIVDAKGDLIAATAADTPARLAVGINGQILTADSTAATGLKWATPSSGGGLTFIAKQDFSAVSSQSVTSVFSSTYDNYVLFITTGSAGGGDVDLRFRTASDDSSSNYNSQSLFATSTTVGAARETSQTFARLGTNSNDGLFTVTLGRPNLAQVSTYTAFGESNTTSPLMTWRGGSLNTTTQYTGFTLLFGGATTGSVSVYGLVKA